MWGNVCDVCLPATWASSGENKKYFSSTKVSYHVDPIALEIKTPTGQLLWGNRALWNGKTIKQKHKWGNIYAPVLL